MFDSGYLFRYASCDRSKHGVDKHIYTFKTELRQKYIVELEEHPHNVFVVKFYLKKHSLSDKKYSLMEGGSVAVAARVFRTCADICTSVLEDRPLASFALIAAPSQDELRYFNTRYRIYRQLLADWFSPDAFIHINSEDKSAYMLINKLNVDTQLVMVETLVRFARTYEELVDLAQEESNLGS